MCARRGALAVQAPPGTGLTSTVERLARSAAGRRSAGSGSAMSTRQPSRRLRRWSEPSPTSPPAPIIDFADAEWSGALDVLVLTGAGRASLADLGAIARSASSLIVCGDPAGLDRPRLRGRHPVALRRSALAHLLDDGGTIPPRLGVLLDESDPTPPGHLSVWSPTSPTTVGCVRPPPSLIRATRKRACAGYRSTTRAGPRPVPKKPEPSPLSSDRSPPAAGTTTSWSSHRSATRPACLPTVFPRVAGWAPSSRSNTRPLVLVVLLADLVRPGGHPRGAQPDLQPTSPDRGTVVRTATRRRRGQSEPARRAVPDTAARRSAQRAAPSDRGRP